MYRAILQAPKLCRGNRNVSILYGVNIINAFAKSSRINKQYPDKIKRLQAIQVKNKIAAVDHSRYFGPQAYRMESKFFPVLLFINIGKNNSMLACKFSCGLTDLII